MIKIALKLFAQASESSKLSERISVKKMVISTSEYLLLLTRKNMKGNIKKEKGEKNELITIQTTRMRYKDH